FSLVTGSFIASYHKVMNISKKMVGKRGIKLAVFYINCSQMIDNQICIRLSKPRRNTLF
ncbi:hypothetical protein HMPREF9446_02605, partial [Bacteroides fluxus YIT 12057]